MESRGQSSCRGQEDGDGSERPLKKARFAWQVKGKHNSKNETNPVISGPEEIQGSASAAPVNMEHDTDTNSWESRKSDSQIDDSDETMAQENPLNPNFSSSRSQNYSYGRSLNLRDENELNVYEISAEDENSLEDHYILHWQTQQMVACCTDNLINRITDKLQTPSTTGSNLRALNMAQFLNHLPADNTVENEGILMAISAHGLRNNSITYGDDDSDDYDDEIDDGNSPNNYQDPIEVSNEEPNPEPETIEDKDVGFFDDVPEFPDDYQVINAAIQFAIVTKGLTASGT